MERAPRAVHIARAVRAVHLPNLSGLCMPLTVESVVYCMAQQIPSLWQCPERQRGHSSHRQVSSEPRLHGHSSYFFYIIPLEYRARPMLSSPTLNSFKLDTHRQIPGKHLKKALEKREWLINILFYVINLDSEQMPTRHHIPRIAKGLKARHDKLGLKLPALYPLPLLAESNDVDVLNGTYHPKPTHIVTAQAEAYTNASSSLPTAVTHYAP